MTMDIVRAFRELRQHGMRVSPLQHCKTGPAFRLSYTDENGTQWQTECPTLKATFAKAQEIIEFHQAFGIWN